MASAPTRIRLKLHHGGALKKDPETGECRYAGGSVYNDAIEATMRYGELCLRLNQKVGEPVSIKYQAPGEDLDVETLVSVTDDDDLQEMYNEYLDALQRPGVHTRTLRIHVFLQPALQFELEEVDEEEDMAAIGESVECHDVLDDYSEAYSCDPSSDAEWHPAPPSSVMAASAAGPLTPAARTAGSMLGGCAPTPATAATGAATGIAGQTQPARTAGGVAAAAVADAPLAPVLGAQASLGAQLSGCAALPLASAVLMLPGGTATTPSLPDGTARATAVPAPWQAAPGVATAPDGCYQLEHHALSNLNRSLQACPVALALAGGGDSTAGLLGSLSGMPGVLGAGASAVPGTHLSVPPLPALVGGLGAGAMAFTEDCFDVEDPYSEEQRDEEEHKQRQQQQQTRVGLARSALPPLPPVAPLAAVQLQQQQAHQLAAAAQAAQHHTWGSSGEASAPRRPTDLPSTHPDRVPTHGHMTSTAQVPAAALSGADAALRNTARHILLHRGATGINICDNNYSDVPAAAAAGGDVYGSPLYNRPLERVRDAASGLPSHISAFGEGYSSGSSAVRALGQGASLLQPPVAGAVAAAPAGDGGAGGAHSIKLPSHISVFGEGSADLPPGHPLHPHMVMMRHAAGAAVRGMAGRGSQQDLQVLAGGPVLGPSDNAFGFEDDSTGLAGYVRLREAQARYEAVASQHLQQDPAAAAQDPTDARVWHASHCITQDFGAADDQEQEQQQPEQQGTAAAHDVLLRFVGHDAHRCPRSLAAPLCGEDLPGGCWPLAPRAHGPGAELAPLNVRHHGARAGSATHTHDNAMNNMVAHGAAGEAVGAGNVPGLPPACPTPKLLLDTVQHVPRSSVSSASKIGEGAFGEVSCAEVFPFGTVAIKWLKKDRFAKYSESFQREAQVLARLNHPNIIRMFGLVTEPVASPPGSSSSSSAMAANANSHVGDAQAYGALQPAGSSSNADNIIIAGIMMEYLRGGSLAQRFRALAQTGRRLGQRERLRIALQAALGMSYLHDQQPAVIHFDLKPDNLLLEGEGDSILVKVADFGLSKHKIQSYVTCHDLRGTLPYMAPELVRCPNQVCEKCDVWSMGVVMWEMVTLEVPFQELTAQDILRGLMQGTLHLRMPSTCEPEWQELILACMQPEPSKRPTFRQLAERLEDMSKRLAAAVQQQQQQQQQQAAAAQAAAAQAVAVAAAQQQQQLELQLQLQAQQQQVQQQKQALFAAAAAAVVGHQQQQATPLTAPAALHLAHHHNHNLSTLGLQQHPAAAFAASKQAPGLAQAFPLLYAPPPPPPAQALQPAGLFGELGLHAQHQVAAAAAAAVAAQAQAQVELLAHQLYTSPSAAAGAAAAGGVAAAAGSAVLHHHLQHMTVSPAHHHHHPLQHHHHHHHQGALALHQAAAAAAAFPMPHI